ncbi:hypothetical protein IB277_19325 [Ensifer sp. ENS07]|uniref:hypothetical protein n=1 Tax=Ensifer sp. ENS07 TaxID=2769274 RepID=UPI0017874B36|nr:hypothetical protein [Ensifer sp. ENS07]MBD9638458.1 hypothetical protein [Ensifer sp. ENS07]
MANELLYQSTRLYINRAAIEKQTLHFLKLNEYLYGKSYLDAVSTLLSIEKNFGYSLFLLSKAAFIYSNKAIGPDLRKVVKSLLDRYGFSGRNVLSLGLVDMMDDSYELLSLRRNLLEFATSKKTDEITREIVCWQVGPISTTSSELSARLNALGSYSLFDAFAFIAIHHLNLDVLATLPLLPTTNGLIPDCLEKAWYALSESPVPDTGGYSDEDPEFEDLVFYRRSIAWLENRAVTRFRAIADHLYTNVTARPLKPPLIEQLSQEYFAAIEKVEDLASERDGFALDLSKYNNSSAGGFTRTLALAHLVTSASKTNPISTPTLLKVMDRTRDVAILLTPAEIKEQFANPAKDAMHDYIVAALLSESIGTSAEKHKLRRVFQDLVLKEYDGNIIKLADFFRVNYPNIAGHLVHLCTEEFLVQLYFLIAEASDVFEKRAELLEWYGDHFGEPAFGDRARTIRLDQRLQKVRGEIDDTRLYVDPVRFGQWFEDNHHDEISSLLKGSFIDTADIDAFTDFGDFTTQRQPHVRLAAVLQSAFQEFCSNKRYGINSYLGRRIRHGTLSGFMVNAVEEIIKEDRFRAIRDNAQASAALATWVDIYRSQVDTWANDILHINDKQHSRGAISATIVDLSKIDIARSAMRMVQEQYHKHGVFTVVTQIIYEYCWRLLETDLSQIRPMIDRGHLSWGNVDQSRLVNACPEDLEACAMALCRALNARTNDVFRTVSSWFTKPVNLSPSAPISVLIEAVLEEVKGHFSDFKPTIVSLGIRDIELVGAVYHHMYDFLYAVIHNAARHGNRTGSIETELQLIPIDAAHQILYVGITSQIRPTDDIASVIEIIESRVAEVSEDAMIVEGNSGIKKIVRLPLDVEEITRTSFGSRDDTLTFAIEMKLARM